MKKRYVFISHSSKDYDRLQPLVAFIKTAGIDCWLSEVNLDKTKRSWRKELMKALRESDSVLLYLTENAIESGEVENEIGEASSMGKNVIPLLPDHIQIPDDIDYLINKYEWINAYMQEEETTQRALRKRLQENFNAMREEFIQTTQSVAFRSFVAEVMRRYYGKAFFTSVNGRDYPVFSLPGRKFDKVKSIRDFDALGDITNSVLCDFDIQDHQKYKQYTWYTEYSKILGRTIRYPNRPGYMLDELQLNDSGEVCGISVHVGTYAENVYSTHVLEYELYRLYRSYNAEDPADQSVWDKILQSMPLRDRMHPDMPLRESGSYYSEMFRSLLRGTGRESLLSVQMIVVMKSEKSKKYEVTIIKRSDMVAILPGVYQFIPAGGFEILNDSNDDVYDDIELEENFSLGCAVFREYLEELFNLPEFEGNGSGSIEERLMKDERIIHIEEMLKNGDADLQFLGSVMELSGLRQELSFALVIHDSEYSKQRFIANEECKKGSVYTIPLDEFERKKSIWKEIHHSSAAMWALFRQTELCKKCIAYNSEQVDG